MDIHVSCPSYREKIFEMNLVLKKITLSTKFWDNKHHKIKIYAALVEWNVQVQKILFLTLALIDHASYLLVAIKWSML